MVKMEDARNCATCGHLITRVNATWRHLSPNGDKFCQLEAQPVEED